jgi:hypothetical protein
VRNGRCLPCGLESVPLPEGRGILIHLGGYLLHQGVGGLAEHQVAWPFTRLDPDDLDEFIERWIEWFATAATGKLGHPSQMPERPPAKSWSRRDGKSGALKDHPGFSAGPTKVIHDL